MNGTNAQEGRVEICVNRVWGTVCQDGFSSDEANIVCRGLGLLNGILVFNYHEFSHNIFGFHYLALSVGPTETLTNAFFGAGTGPIFLALLACAGREVNLLNCTSGRDRGITRCIHAEDVSVRCPGMCR